MKQNNFMYQPIATKTINEGNNSLEQNKQEGIVMKKELILNLVNQMQNKKGSLRAGRLTSMSKTKDLGVVKATGQHITKKTEGLVVRLGVDYSHMASSPAPEQIQSLPWGHWYIAPDGHDYTGYVIEHESKATREKREKLGITEPQWSYYLRVAPNPNGHKCKTTYMDQTGKELTYDEVSQLVAPSKLKSTEAAVYDINFEDILSLTQTPAKPRKRKSSKSNKKSK